MSNIIYKFNNFFSSNSAELKVTVVTKNSNFSLLSILSLSIKGIILKSSPMLEA
jgi:hypothetical protein